MGKEQIPELRIEKIEIVQLANRKDVKVWFVSHPHPVSERTGKNRLAGSGLSFYPRSPPPSSRSPSMGAWRLFLRRGREGAETRRSTSSLSVCSFYGSFFPGSLPKLLIMEGFLITRDVLSWIWLTFVFLSLKKVWIPFLLSQGWWQILTKRKFFSAGMDEDAQHNVENLFGFKEGTFPMGCPLFPLDSQPETVGLSLIRLP